MKKLLLSLLLFFCSIISFSIADYSFLTKTSYSFSSSNIRYDFTLDSDILCLMPSTNAFDSSKIKIAYLSGGFDNNVNLLNKKVIYVNNLFCINQDFGIEFLTGNYNSYGFYLFSWLDYVGSCDVMTSNECQSNYDLIPISDVDQEYCLGNSLCPEIESGSGECENESGDVQWSALYINDIQHLGKPLINIDIPDYIFWDYSTDDEEFNLYIGSGYDQEYIDNVIAINSYRPDSQDFTDVFIGGLTLIFPYIVIVLFIVFVRKLIKRIFK